MSALQFIISLGLLGIAFAGVIQVRTTNTDQDLILQLHNDFRKVVSPNATDMRKMYWNDDLARAAAEFVVKCTGGHDNSYDRRKSADIGAQVGQNAAARHPDWTSAITGWHNESIYFDYDTNQANTPGEDIGHYTQVVWATSSLVGCAYDDCNGDKHYVCNYAYGNMVNQKPYTEGNSCAACDGRCVEGTLCDCPAGKICKNGGVLDLTTCTCTCHNHFTGDDCEICPFEDLNSACGDAVHGYTQDMCSKYANVPEVCPVMCGFCPDTCPGMDIRSCKNGGNLLPDCTCACPTGFSGDLCETNAACANDDPGYCVSQWPPSFCDQYPTIVPARCPHMCGQC